MFSRAGSVGIYWPVPQRILQEVINSFLSPWKTISISLKLSVQVQDNSIWSRYWSARIFHDQKARSQHAQGRALNGSGQEGGFSSKVSSLTKSSHCPAKLSLFKHSSPKILMNSSCLGHFKVFQGCHPSPPAAWIDSSGQLSPRFLSLVVGKVFLLCGPCYCATNSRISGA